MFKSNYCHLFCIKSEHQFCMHYMSTRNVKPGIYTNASSDTPNTLTRINANIYSEPVVKCTFKFLACEVPCGTS